MQPLELEVMIHNLDALIFKLKNAAMQGRRTRREREAMELMEQARIKLAADLQARLQPQEVHHGE